MAIAITEEFSPALPNLQPLWHPKAPRSLVETCPDPFTGWSAWQQHLRKRKKPKSPPLDSTNSTKSPLLWGWPADWDRASIAESLASPTALAEIILGDDANTPPDLPQSLQTVALAYAMPTMSRELPAEAWWQLLERLHEIATQAQTKRVEWPADPQDVLRRQLLAGELPLALSCHFPEVRAMHALRNDARAALSEALLELTDGQGLPDVRLFPVLGPLVACWTRARWIGSQLKRGPWSREAELQFQWTVRHAIRLADRNGRFLLTPPNSGEAWSADMLKMAIELAGDKGDRAAAAIALPRGVVPKKHSKNSKKRPDPSLNSDWAGITIMSDGWAQSDVRLALAFASEPMTIELSVAGESLVNGSWTSETSCDGKPVHAIGEWEQLCWESGKRFDLLELCRELSDGLRQERQLVFGRQDRVLYVADMIISRDNPSRTIQHVVSLPLAPNTHWKPEAETRDGVLTNLDVKSAVTPLALSEWRSDPRGGTLDEQSGRLVLTLESSGAAVCCPLLFDLDPDRSTEQRTWRQLTVGEDQEIVPRDRAVAYRAQSGKDQWVFYRSLGPVGNRTFLGQNIAGEFSAGRFSATGKYKEWIEIEAV